MQDLEHHIESYPAYKPQPPECWDLPLASSYDTTSTTAAHIFHPFSPCSTLQPSPYPVGLREWPANTEHPPSSHRSVNAAQVQSLMFIQSKPRRACRSYVAGMSLMGPGTSAGAGADNHPKVEELREREQQQHNAAHLLPPLRASSLRISFRSTAGIKTSRHHRIDARMGPPMLLRGPELANSIPGNGRKPTPRDAAEPFSRCR
ncbi:hypothetical protein VTK56DRAFT_4001 [Thermocarpiscus australiensis]